VKLSSDYLVLIVQMQEQNTSTERCVVVSSIMVLVSEVLGSNLGPKTGYSYGFSLFSSGLAVEY
jgi:hypothetical protein